MNYDYAQRKYTMNFLKTDYEIMNENFMKINFESMNIHYENKS